MTARSPESTRRRLEESAIRLASVRGARAVSVRRIARDAGVTEGALYRHYPSKEALFRAVFLRVVEPQLEVKRHLVEAGGPVRPRLGDWVRTTYEAFDADPHAFAGLLLLPLDFAAPAADLSTRQGDLFDELCRQGIAAGEVCSMSAGLTRSLFTGMLLSVPRQIVAGALHGPATDHADAVADAAWRVLAGQGGSKNGAPAK